MSSYINRVLWADVSGFDMERNPKPYLCVSESTDGLLVSLELIDLEYAETLTLFVSDVDMIISNSKARWDDQGG